jgi:aminopeptidase YwaD
MKQKTFRCFTKSCIVLLCVTLVSSATALPLSPMISKKQTIATTGTPKITDVVSLIDEALITEYLQRLVGIGPRMTGTYGCEKAAQYINEQFTDMGLQTRYQNWSSWGNKHYHYFYDAQNVEGILPGMDTDESAIIFNAHYDSVAAGPGANDDGSGTVAVLAAAYALSHFTFQRPIKFVTFSGEEIGLDGSLAYTKEAYEHNDSILVEINADMVGHDEGSRTMRVTASEDAGWVADTFQMVNQSYSSGLTVTLGTINRVNHNLGGSDYSTFLAYGWETIACWETDHDLNFHSANDDLSNVNISYLVNTTRLIAATIATLADESDVPVQVRITSPRVGFLYNEGMQKHELRKLKTTVIDDIWVWAEVEHATAPLLRAEFYYDGKLVFTDLEEPFAWHFNKFSLRNHEVSVIVYDSLGRSSFDWRSIRFVNILKNR